MFKVVKKNENRLDLKLSGKIDSDEMKKAIDELMLHSNGMENGVMLYEIIDFHFPSLAAIGHEFSRLPEMFKLIGRFDRVAVVTDKAWIKAAAEIECALIPGIESKAFNLDQKMDAEKWLQL